MPLMKLIEMHQLVPNSLPRIRRYNHPKFQILVYHRVLAKNDPFAIAPLTVQEFDQQMKTLTSYFRVISLEQLMDELDSNSVKPYTVCITFDDGYIDNFQFAFPILSEYQLPATIFLTTDFIGTNKKLWPDRVLHTFKNTNINKFHYEEAKYYNCHLTSIKKRREIAFFLLEWLKNFSPDERDKHIEKILNICHISNHSKERLMLNWDEVRTMHSAGISFGAHTKTHPILSSLRESEIRNEIIGSKRAIEDSLDTSISTFAYPNGKPHDFDERCKRVVSEAGFRCAVTTCPGINTYKNDRYELFREMPWDTCPHSFYARLLISRLLVSC